MSEQPQEYRVRTGEIENGTDVHSRVTKYFVDEGFVPFDPINGFSRAVYGSSRGTALITRKSGGSGFGLEIHLGTADSDLLADFAVKFPEVKLR